MPDMPSTSLVAAVAPRKIILKEEKIYYKMIYYNLYLSCPKLEFVTQTKN